MTIGSYKTAASALNSQSPAGVLQPLFVCLFVLLLARREDALLLACLVFFIINASESQLKLCPPFIPASLRAADQTLSSPPYVHSVRSRVRAQVGSLCIFFSFYK